MKIARMRATRFEAVLSEGRTHPVVLACRSNEPDIQARPFVVKAIGCPEVVRKWQLVAEVVGNAAARRIGIATPEPAVVQVSRAMADAVNQTEEVRMFGFAIEPGYAAGCALLTMQPFTKDQRLGPQMRDQAARLFLFDLIAQNADRRHDKVNCGLTSEGIVAFDFELCFAHLFLPLIGGSPNAWEPSKSSGLARNHLFRSAVENNPPSKEAVIDLLDKLSPEWWQILVESLPAEWQGEAAKIGNSLLGVVEHADDFYKDIVNRCLT